MATVKRPNEPSAQPIKSPAHLGDEKRGPKPTTEIEGRHPAAKAARGTDLPTSPGALAPLLRTRRLRPPPPFPTGSRGSPPSGSRPAVAIFSPFSRPLPPARPPGRSRPRRRDRSPAEEEKEGEEEEGDRGWRPPGAGPGAAGGARGDKGGRRQPRRTPARARSPRTYPVAAGALPQDSCSCYFHSIGGDCPIVCSNEVCPPDGSTSRSNTILLCWNKLQWLHGLTLDKAGLLD
ncbi:basic salivary proline-rich protein 1-like isoform X1 [Gallus gallus]|uniref:basic salivary proline-rich protein 1-like isoform X1 n=1 Tax=Gallus gallus TaxID=9031 RepID=UPI001F00B4EF|nr:basic salivary proline-rich protein 1-like isoform X1 [Gallus gallus]